MSRMAVYVERNNTFKRLLERYVEELQTELKCRLLQIEQTQYEILKSFGNQIDIIAKYSYTLSPRKRRRLISEMNLHYVGAPGKSAAKQTILKHTLSEKDILAEQQSVCLRCGGRIKDNKETDTSEQYCELCSLRSRAFARKDTKKGVKEDDHSDSVVSDRGRNIRRGNSFSDKQYYEKDKTGKDLDTNLKRNLSFTITKDQQIKSEVDGAHVNLTAFAFSRYSQCHNGMPLKRRNFESPNNERLKRGIRTKVVQNYLLCDVFKRLSDRNNSLARMKIDGMPEDCTDETRYTYEVVQNLQKCRYLRVPKTLQESDDDKMTKIDID